MQSNSDIAVMVPLKKIKPNPYQPRTAEDPAALQELAINIYRNGMMQTPSARAVNGHYELVFGHTRAAAYELLATKGVPAAEIRPDKKFLEMPLFIRQVDDRQMFEMAVAENLKRRDLNAIETAQALQRYMDEFNASSKEAGELFGMNDATVRGKVRLLELPKPVQEKLAEGKVSEGVVRQLLPLQKLGGEETVLSAFKRIEKGVNDWGDKLDPEEVIADVIEELDHLKLMFRSWHGGEKPRSGEDGWMLDMKTFPNKLLPDLTQVDLAMGLEVQNDKRTLSLIEKAFETHNSPVDAVVGGLKNHRPELVDRINHLVNPPACTACPFYTVNQKAHYCGLKVCHERKSTAWSRHLIQEASKKLGIAIYNPETDGGAYVVLFDVYSWRDEHPHLQLFNKKHKDLRLALAEDIDRKKPQHGYSGVPKSSRVILLGGSTLDSIQESARQERAEKRAKTNLEDLLHHKLLELEWQAAICVKNIFDGLNDEAVDNLSLVVENPIGDEADFIDAKEEELEIDEKAQADFLRTKITFNVIHEQCSFHRTAADHAKELTDLAKNWGVKLPKSVMKLAEQMDDEIKTVAAETAKAKAAKKAGKAKK